MSDPRKRPTTERALATGRLSRMAGMARAGASMIRGTLSRDAIAPIERAAETLGELRGLATKAGQMAGIWSAMLPPAERARAEPILARLRAATATSSPDAIVAIIERELGAPVDALFARFDRSPFASASLGQVHGAMLPEALGGGEVAVKVQHPGIEEALRADLDNAARIGGVAAVLAVPSAGDMVAEVRARIEEELDYAAEARWQARFAEIVAGDPQLRVPRVIAARSSRRVLTTERVNGHTAAVAATRLQARSQALAVRRFVRTAWLEHGLLFADPHAGNWIFHDDGAVTVLDFGSVLTWSEPERALWRGAIEGDEVTRRASLESLVGRTSSAAPTVDVLMLALGPLATDAPVGTEQLAALGKLGTEVKKKSLGRGVHLPPWLPLVLRALIGTMALLVELEAAVPASP